jgi:hypothetical protein
MKSVIWGPPKVRSPWQLPKLPYLNPALSLRASDYARVVRGVYMIISPIHEAVNKLNTT